MPTSLKRLVAVLGRRQRADVARQQRQHLVDGEGADHEELKSAAFEKRSR